MENAIKMKIVPISKNEPEIDDIMKIILKLYKKGYVNDQLNVKIGKEFKVNTSILDYFSENKNLPNYKEIHSLIEGKNLIKEQVFTDISPIKIRQSKINKKPNWIIIK